MMTCGHLSTAKAIRRVLLIGIALWVLLTLFGRAEAALTAVLEGPENEQTVSGVAVIRGWAFSDTAGVTISQVNLLIDGNAITPIACCSPRGDVAANFPQFPAANTTNSGFGLTVNYNLLSPGRHTVQVKVADSSGAQQDLTNAVTVVRAGDSQFLDQVDLTAATAQRDGQDVVLTGVRVRDKASQQVSQISARLRWFKNIQGLGLIEASTTGAATLQARQSRAQEAAEGAQLSPIKAMIESPSNGQTVSGIAVIRGWAFAPAGRSITRVQIVIDGMSGPTIPCCSDRADVAAAFPGETNARNSGFGITFNYGVLSGGVHMIAVKIEDSAGDKRTLTAGMIVKQPGQFEFLTALDFSAATVRLAGGALVVEGATAQDSVSGQVVTRTLRYQFDIASQSFVLTEENVAEVQMTNFNCTLNGDTSSLSALQSNPGSDGISLPEVIQAINNTPDTGHVLAMWEVAGTLQCGAFTAITRGNVTINGDVNNDGLADVTLDGAGSSTATDELTVSASAVIIRGLAIRNFTGTGLSIIASPAQSLSDVAIVGVTTIAPPNGSGLVIVANAKESQAAYIRALLISGNQFTGGVFGVAILARGTDAVTGGNTLSNAMVSGNRMQDNIQAGVLVGSQLSSRNTIDVTVSDNQIINAGIGIILEGGRGIGSQNILIGQVLGNRVQNSAFDGIRLLAGTASSSSNTIEAAVTDNIVMNPAGGIVAVGGVRGAPDNIITAEIQRNQVSKSVLGGVFVAGGTSSSRNLVHTIVSDNNMTDTATLASILLAGGAEEKDSLVMGEVRGNQIHGSTADGIHLQGGFSASACAVMAMTADNMVGNSGENGILLSAGTTQPIPLGDRQSQGTARENSITGQVLHNTVQESGESGIAVIGGFDSSTGEVVGNRAQEEVSGNTADGISCTDGIAGNTATCTGSDGVLKSQESERAELSLSHGAQLQLSPALMQSFEAHMNNLHVREEHIREQAESIQDEHLRNRVLRLGTRLEALKQRLFIRSVGQSHSRIDP